MTVPATAAPLPSQGRSARATAGIRAFGRSLWRAPCRGEVQVLLVAAVVIQLAFLARHDWPAHLAAGGGTVLGVAALTPRRRAVWAGPFGLAVVALLGWVTEATVFGPFDPVDIAVTLVGALFAAAGAAEVAASSAADRRSALHWCALVVVVALVYRFGLDPRG